jgi:(p)ppGpp synthase/HD superfamily hydrolase
MAHLLGTASIALEHGANEDEAIAALLHDAVEDHGPEQLTEIRHRFGSIVAEIVAGCSDSNELPKPPWRERKEAYVRHLPHASSSVRLVSASDKLYNALAILKDYQAIGEPVWNRFNATKGEILWYYRALVTAFREAGTTPLVDELDHVVSGLETVAVKA